MGSPVAGSHKQHGTRSYARQDIRTEVMYSQSALATSAPLAWAYVGALSLTFCLCCWVLQWVHPIDRDNWNAFNQQVPSWVFTAQVAAFGGVLVLNIINLMFCSAPVQYNCNVLLALIHGVAFATDYLLEVQATPVVMSWGGRLFVPLRYIQWTHTTPTMILLMAMQSSTSSSWVGWAMVADLVMVLMGLAATWTDGVPQIIFLTISMVAFVVVLSAIVDMFKGAMAETQHDPAVYRLMERLLWLTLLVWALFPMVWTAARLGYISLSTEQLFWGVSDYGAKVVFSSHLWQKNLTTVQQRREAAQELLRALDRGVLLDRLRGLLAAKERLVHALQHELTTPIHGMMALVQELLHNKTQSASSRTRMLLMIRSSAVCLLNTISTALNSSSNSNAQDGLSGQASNGTGVDSPSGRRKVHLWRVAESVVRLTRPLMRDHVRIVNCISRDMPPVKGDSARLMQVLMNLVCSSLKYTASGAIKISASQTHSAAQVVVADTGAGIPPQQLQQALDPFEMLEGHGGPGSTPPELWDVCRTGLGLYLVSQTLSSMGSSLAARSEVGKGSTFEFEVPLADSDCESESEADADLFSEPASLRGSLDLLGPHPDSPPQQGQRPSDVSSSHQHHQQRRSNSRRDLNPPAAADGGAGSSSGSSGLGVTLLSGAGGVGSAAGAVDAASAGLVAKKNHRTVHNGVIQVLSVDDDQVNQLVASTALRIHKWEVVKCMSGAEALDYLLQRCTVLPDLVLLDVMMPTMSGYEVAKRVREVWPSSLLPIIMLSAKTEEEDIVQGLRCGADDYVPKPFKRAELAARIRAHIRARDAFQQQQAEEQQWMLQHNLLPLNVQRKLRNGETVIAESHPAATVLWAEVLGPTAAAASSMAALPAAAGSNAATSLQEALKRISSQQQLTLPPAAAAAADGTAAAADGDGGGTEVAAVSRSSSDAAAAAAAAGGVVSRSSSGTGLAGGDVVPSLPVGPYPSGLSPAEAVVRLNSLYTTWEELCAKQDVLGVDFSGSTFVAVSGHDDHPNHTQLILRAAAAMLAVAAATPQPDGSPLAVRVGIHTGPLTTGLVGSKAVKLVLMGDTVEGARQLAATGCPGAAHISSQVYTALQQQLQQQQQPAAAAGPWSLQRLPGATSRQPTYLLLSQNGSWTALSAAAGSTTAAAAGSTTAAAAAGDGQHQQQPTAGVAAILTASSSSVATEGAAGATQGSQQEASRAPAPAPAAAAAGDAVKLEGSSSPAAAAAIGPSAPGTPATAADPASGSSDPAAAAAGTCMSDTPGSSRPSPQQQQQQQQQSPGDAGRQLSAVAAAHSPPPSRFSVATAVSSLAVNPSGSLSAGPISSTSSSDKLHAAAAQPTEATAAAAAAATAATAAMVACLTSFGSSDGSSSSSGVSPGDASAASLLALQQAGSVLVGQLGSERRQLQQQLLERTQQHAAAAAELACVREQLGQAAATAEQRGQQVEALRHQVSALLVRAHLADCWQALATMKAQVGSIHGGAAAALTLGGAGGLSALLPQQAPLLLGGGLGALGQLPQLTAAAGGGGTGLGGGPALMQQLSMGSGGAPSSSNSGEGQQQQQQQQQLNGQQVSAAEAGAGGSNPGMLALLQQTQQLQQQLQMQQKQQQLQVLQQQQQAAAAAPSLHQALMPPASGAGPGFPSLQRHYQQQQQQ